MSINSVAVIITMQWSNQTKKAKYKCKGNGKKKYDDIPLANS